MSKKGKVPWIVYNGEQVDDSEFIIQYLNNKFGKFHVDFPECIKF